VCSELAQVNLKYFDLKPNAGDQFSRRVAQKYLSQDVVSVGQRDCSEPNIILLGSILQWADENSLICGSGLIKGDLKLAHAPKGITCVRGPLTRAALASQGIESPARFADPGVLAPDLFPEEEKVEYSIGIVPHYVDADSRWLEATRERGCPVIDVKGPLETYFRQMKQCATIASSTLHGLIFAHALGIPAVWIELSDRVIGDGFKFYDYYGSLGRDRDRVKPIRIGGHETLEDIAARAELPGGLAALRDDCLDALGQVKSLYEDAVR